MMRKVMSMLLAAVMLLACVPAMAAEEDTSVFALYTGEKLIGSGFLTAGGEAILTVAQCAQADYAVNGAGERLGVKGEASDRVVAALFPNGDTAIQSTLFSGVFDPDNLVCVGLDAQGNVVKTKPRQVAPFLYNGHSAVTLTLPGTELLPGAGLLDDNGSLSGLIVAAYGEGEGRYVAYTAEGLYFALAGLEDAPELETPAAKPDLQQDSGCWLTDVKAEVVNGILTLDWSGCDIPDMDDNSMYEVTFQDFRNSFFQSGVATGVQEAVFAVAPGHEYVFIVEHLHGEPSLENAFTRAPYTVWQTVSAPRTEPFDRFGYADSFIHLSAVPAGTAVEDGVALPATDKISCDMLDCSVDFYMSVGSTYQVTQHEESTLVIVVETPAGETYAMVAGFFFEPEVMENDVWNCPINELLLPMALGKVETGVYKLSYYLDGQLASETTFEME